MPKGTLAFFFLFAAIIAGCAAKKEPVAPPVQPAEYSDAVDLKQRFAGMAEQLLAATPAGNLKGYVAIPTVFANENAPGQVTPLGRLLAESMEYEFGQRNITAREYQSIGGITNTDSLNDMAVKASRGIGGKSKRLTAILVGAYQVTRDATFINARLVNPVNNIVISTADLILQNSPLVLSLARGTNTATAAGSSAPRAYVSSQSAPVLSPTYPTLGGSVLQRGTAGIPIVQGR